MDNSVKNDKQVKKTKENCGKYIFFEIENVAYVKGML